MRKACPILRKNGKLSKKDTTFTKFILNARKNIICVPIWIYKVFCNLLQNIYHNKYSNSCFVVFCMFITLSYKGVSKTHITQHKNYVFPVLFPL